MRKHNRKEREMLENLNVKKTKAISSQVSQMRERFNDYSERKYSQVAGSALDPQGDHDIVSSASKYAAVRKDGLSVTNLGEDFRTLTVTASDAMKYLFEYLDQVAKLILEEPYEDFRLAA